MPLPSIDIPFSVTWIRFFAPYTTPCPSSFFNDGPFDFGGYVFSKFKSGKWTVTGGIRFDTRHIQGNDFYTSTDTQTGFARHVTGTNTVGAYLQFPTLKLHYNGVSASIGATYTANEHTSLKLNVARGYRAPNITESASNGLDPGGHIVYIGNRNFKPEFSFQRDKWISIHRWLPE